MISEINLKKIINDHERRITHLESIFAKPKTAVPTKGKRKLSDYVMDLRGNRYFSQPKTAEEVHEKLQETYHCELNRVAVALLRMSKRRQLRRATKVIEKKKYQAYVW